MRINSSKTVKLQGKLRVSQKHLSRSKFVPWLTLSGVWLQRNGFNIGDKLRIVPREKLLLIEVVEEPAEPETVQEIQPQRSSQTQKR
jgi:toxic protein SymE